MTKLVPRTYTPHPASKAGSGAPDKLELARDISGNMHHIYGRKIGWCQSGCTSWNQGKYEGDIIDQKFASPFVVIWNADERREIARIKVPSSISGKRRLRVVSSYSGDINAGKLWVISDTGQTQSFSPSVTGSLISVSAGEWIILEVRSSGVSSGSPLEIVSVSMWYDEADYAGEGGPPSWQPLALAWITDDRPDSSYYLQSIIRNQASSLCEASNSIFARSLIVPWTNSGSFSRITDHRVYLEDHSPGILLYFYARVQYDSTSPTSPQTGDIRIDVNGVTLTTESLSNSVSEEGWELFGPYDLSSLTTSGAINHIELYGRKTVDAGEGTGIQVAGIYAWEMAATQVTLSTPDAIPASYQGNDNDAYVGFFPILEDLDQLGGGSARVGRASWAKDATWLKSNRRRILIMDWVHRSLYWSYMNQVSWKTNPNPGTSPPAFDTHIPWNVQGTWVVPSEGGVLGIFHWPAVKGFTQVDIWVRVTLFRGDGEQGAPNGGIGYLVGILSLEEGSVDPPGSAGANPRPVTSDMTRICDITNSQSQEMAYVLGPFTATVSDNINTSLYVMATKLFGPQISDSIILHDVIIAHKPLEVIS